MSAKYLTVVNSAVSVAKETHLLEKAPLLSTLMCKDGSSRRTKCTSEETMDSTMNVKPFSEIPGPTGLPYLGNMLSYRMPGGHKINKRIEALRYKYRKYGPIVKETILGETIVHLFDPDAIQTVYQNDTKTPYIPPVMVAVRKYREKRNLSPGLANLNGEHWYRLRGAVQQMMMRPKAVTVFLPMVLEVAEEFFEYITPLRGEDGEIPDFMNKITLWNFESAAYKCFGKRMHGMNNDKDSVVQKMISSNATVFEISTMLKYRLPFYNILETPSWRKMVECEDYFMQNGTKFMDEALTEIQKQMDSGSEADSKYKFLEYLLSKHELEYKDMHILTMSLFNDGLRTTTAALIFNLYCLAKNPNVQQRLYDEIQQMQPIGKPITSESLNELRYLKAVIKETFRVFPIGTEVSRFLQKDLVIGGYHMPAGSRVDINQSVMLKSPKYFEHPNEFLPERWLRDGSAHDINAFVFTPFSHGARMCVGRRFAEQELNVLLVMFLQRFHLEWHHDDLSHDYYIFEYPDRPARLSFYDRH